jgi:hypothetical protein
MMSCDICASYAKALSSIVEALAKAGQYERALELAKSIGWCHGHERFGFLEKRSQVRSIVSDNSKGG